MSLEISKGVRLDHLLLLRNAAKSRLKQYYEYPIGYIDGVPQHTWPKDRNRCLLCNQFWWEQSCRSKCPGLTVTYRGVPVCHVYTEKTVIADAWDNDRSQMIREIIEELSDMKCEVVQK